MASPQETMRRWNVFLPVTLLTRLQAESQKTGAPMAEIIRRACTSYFKDIDGVGRATDRSSGDSATPGT